MQLTSNFYLNDKLISEYCLPNSSDSSFDCLSLNDNISLVSKTCNLEGFVGFIHEKIVSVL